MTYRKVLFDRVRANVFHGVLGQGQVDGISHMLDYAEARREPTKWLAYELATATWETGRTMQPVEEAFALPPARREAYLRSKAYYPYYGRGLIHVTWKTNYDKFGIARADDLLTWPVALRALFDGMQKGMFTGKKLSDYISADGARFDFKEARRIVNGTDRAGDIAAIAQNWLTALIAARYGDAVTQASRPVSPIAPPPPRPSPAPVQPLAPEASFAGLWSRVGAALKGAFFKRAA